MSRRKIQRKKGKQKKGQTVYSTTTVPVFNQDTKQVEIHGSTWVMTEEQISFMPIYQRAHRLMPIPKSFVMDPNEYRDELTPSIELVDRVLEGENVPADDLLRAIAILGHTPDEESIRSLSRFTQSNHSLAGVADLALAECGGLLTIFKKTAKAS
ncbi:MAG: hypothetical protein GY847_35375 [Proteobacteria bacterium]|nr:hypothetical protein [Pseudomonadota bacterium]